MSVFSRLAGDFLFVLSLPADVEQMSDGVTKSMVFILRAVAVLALLLTVVAGFLIERRLTHESGVLHVSWIVLCLAWVVMPGWFVVRGQPQIEFVVRLYSRVPKRSLVFLVNTCLFMVVIVSVFEYWGMLLSVMILTVLSFLLARATVSGVSALESIVRNSPVSFAMMFLGMFAGEFYLRMNPRIIYRGGGFNPAVRAEQANLYELNSLGLRNQPVTESPADGDFRILAVGDSFTFGQGVKNDETYPRILERLLNERVGAAQCDVVNAGNCGANTANELDFLRYTGFKLQPNLVLVQFYLNDVFPPRPKRTVVDEVMEKLTFPARRSYVLFLANDLFRTVRYGGDIKMSAARIVERGGPGWKRCAAGIGGLAALCRENHTPLVMILYPGVSGSDQAERLIHPAVTAECARNNVPVIDLLGVFDDVPPERRYAHPADHHPSAAVHDLVARHIVAELRRHDLLPADTVTE